MGHETSQCVPFRDLVQNALKDGRLKFADKQKPCPEEEAETKVKALFVEPVDIMVVDTVDSVGAEDNKPNCEDQAARAYPKAEEELVEFLNCFRSKDSEVILCPKCSSVFDKEVAKEMERRNPYQVQKFVRHDKPNEPFSRKGKGPTKFQGRTYVPITDASPREWLRHARKSETGGGKWKVVNVDFGPSYRDNSQVSKKYSYVSQIYMGKNPMTMTQWKRHQRKKKVAREARSSSGSDSIQFFKKG